MATLPPLVLSLGDPCGIGPEIVAAAWRALKDESDLAFCVIGDAVTLEAQSVAVARLDAPYEAATAFAAALPVLDRPLDIRAVPGHPDPIHAPHVTGWIAEGVTLCRVGAARGLVTAPIAKSVLYRSGFAFPGHTEYLAELCRDGGEAPVPVMMLAAPDLANKADLRVVLATIHVPLAEVPGALTVDGLCKIARITLSALRRDFGVAEPRLAVAGLNPHAGEGGDIGREEIDIIVPAVTRLRAEGLDVRGPAPADSLFHDEARTRYDAVLCMYHDQGLIPLKTLDFWGGVNITLGLPIVRTSPDHGTGFDIAGRGVARADSLVNAIRKADAISRRRTT